ncbi:ComEC/Rec2 family competence protein [Thermosynechococcaceae cyanobacterium Okahandja]
MVSRVTKRDVVLWGLAFLSGCILALVQGGWLIVLATGGMLWWLRRQRWGGSLWLWLPPSGSVAIATAVALLAMAYLWLRTPQPGVTDISGVVGRLVNLNLPPSVAVTGVVQTSPLPNRSGRLRFFMAVAQYRNVSQDPREDGLLRGSARGRLYVTLPRAIATDIHPGQRIEVVGVLYRPRASGSRFIRTFNFQRQLQLQHTFAGLTGEQLRVLEQGSGWGLWAIRQRIAEAHRAGLGDRYGPVVSAMVLGSRAVAVPFDLRDSFRRVGLSHALAASGFHTAILLTVVLTLARPLPQVWRYSCGGGVLLLFVCLSGFAPSAIRAGLMGLASLLALAGSQKVQPTTVLLAIACGMLLYNPLWIEDIGFQLSFIATLGLIVSTQPISDRLDWCPTLLRNLLAVPLAATLWVFPLSLAIFGIFPVYGLLANILATGLLILLTVGGFISALAALLLPGLGAGIATLLYWPTALLLWLVQHLGQWPGATIALGGLGWGQVVVLYTLILLVWWHPWWQRRWLAVFATGLALVLVPFILRQQLLFQATVLANTRVPMLVIQQPAGIIAINGGEGHVLTSFLAQEGINRIDWAIASSGQQRYQQGWPDIQATTPVRRLSTVATSRTDPDYQKMLAALPVVHDTLPLQQPNRLGNVEITVQRADPAVLSLDLGDSHWLFVSDPAGDQGIWLRGTTLSRVDVLWWWGRSFDLELLERLQPKAIIFTQARLAPQLSEALRQKQIPYFVVGQDGEVRWTPNAPLKANLDTTAEGIF